MNTPQAKHTPGPWHCPQWFNKMTGCWPVNLPSGQIEVRTDNGLADACLIASAPALLEALQAIDQWLLPDLIEDTKAYGDPKRLAQIEVYRQQARAAIQAATLNQ